MNCTSCHAMGSASCPCAPPAREPRRLLTPPLPRI
jgi:hypothetical protein